jgi:hypothetical protein
VFCDILIRQIKMAKFEKGYNNDKLEPNQSIKLLIKMNMEGYNKLIQCICRNYYADMTVFCPVIKKRKRISMKMFLENV